MDCIFCKIINKEESATILYSGNDALSILDIHPYNEGHTLIIPRQHIQSIAELSAEQLTGIQVVICRRIAELEAMGYSGQKIVVNQGDVMEIPHLHIHLVGLKENDQGADIV